MTPFYEGWARSRAMLDDLTRPAEPVDEVIRPSVGYRIGRSLVHVGATLMGRRRAPRGEYELAA